MNDEVLKPKAAKLAVEGMLLAANTYDRRATWKLLVGYGNDPDGWYAQLLRYQPTLKRGCVSPESRSMVTAGPFRTARKALMWSHQFGEDVWIDPDELEKGFPLD